MYETFVFDFRSSSLNKLFTVAYCPSKLVDARDVQRSLQKHFEFDNLTPPEMVLLLGTSSCADSITGIAKHDLTLLPLPSYTRQSPTPVVALCLNRHQQIKTTTPEYSDTAAMLESGFLNELKYQGLKRIFIKREGIIGDEKGWHFVKPSKKHASKFIRTANVLIHGAEVSFIAFCMLPYMSDNIRHIYTDTSTINQVAYAAVSLKQSINNAFRPPTIDSFGSYDGLDKFDFYGEKESLFVISASTSGELEQHILERLPLITQRSIVTLFYLSAPIPRGSQIICDITSRPGGPGWLDAVKSFDRRNCPLCKHLPAVEIIGDQFLIQNLAVETATITKDHVPTWLESFLLDFAGTKVIAAHRKSADARTGARSSKEIYLDLENYVGKRSSPRGKNGWTGPENSYLEKFDRRLSQSVPASLKTIIYLDDPASAVLSKRISNYFFRSGGKSRPRQISAEKIRQGKAAMRQKLLERGSTLVVAGTMVTGRTLMELSQLIRSYKHTGGVTYLIGISRTRSEEQLREIRTNLEHGKARNPDYIMHTVADVYIPDDPPFRPSPWDTERKVIDKIRRAVTRSNHNMSVDDEALQLLAQRSDLISRAKNNIGLHNDLFWPSIQDGAILQIRPGFRLWSHPFEKRGASQADVYFTMSATLHEWRKKHKPFGNYHGEYRRVVISPGVFMRLNDGVLQSALLRATERGELNYSLSESLTKEMVVVLNSIFLNYREQVGEACIEFLMAIAAERLQLLPDYTDKVISVLLAHLTSDSSEGKLKGVAKVLCEYIMMQSKSGR